MYATMHKCHKDGSYSNIEFLLLPPNATSILQLLDQGIILSIKRRYKAKLAEKYLAFVENKEDVVVQLKQFDVVAATNMIAQAWRETSSIIIKNCFKKASFIHPELGEEPEPEEPPVAPNPQSWRKVEKWLEMNFEEFVAHEPPAATTAPMTDEEIVHMIRTENDAPQEDSEDDISQTNIIKSASEFLSVIEQQKAFLLKNKLLIEVVYELESVILGNQLSLCNKQKEVTDYFSSSQSPKSKSQHSFQSKADLSGNLTIVDSLSDVGSPFDDIEGMQFDTMSVVTSIALVTASALMRHDILPEFTSSPKPKCQRCNSQNKHTVASPTPTTSQDKRSFSSLASLTPTTENDKKSFSSSASLTPMTKKDKTSLSSSTSPTLMKRRIKQA